MPTTTNSVRDFPAFGKQSKDPATVSVAYLPAQFEA